MSSLQKIGKVVLGILMAACGALVLAYPKDGLDVMGWFFSVALAIAGIRLLCYYLSMGRHMVGGKALLFLGILLVDFGVLAASLTDSPNVYLVVYLIAIHAFTGLINLLRANEAKKVGGQWQFTMLQGVVSLLIAVACVVFIKSPDTIALIFCAGMFWSAGVNIVSAFKQTQIVYVQ